MKFDFFEANYSNKLVSIDHENEEYRRKKKIRKKKLQTENFQPADRQSRFYTRKITQVREMMTATAD